MSEKITQGNNNYTLYLNKVIIILFVTGLIFLSPTIIQNSHAQNTTSTSANQTSKSEESTKPSLSKSVSPITNQLNKIQANLSSALSSATANNTSQSKSLQPQNQFSFQPQSLIQHYPVQLPSNTSQSKSLQPQNQFSFQPKQGILQSTPGSGVTEPQSTTPTYRITVTFNSVTVHNSHEGFLSGTGEYDLGVYVQGKLISLTNAGGSGGGLWDVSSGETVTFPAGTKVTVDVPSNLPLSVFTVGFEIDGCDRTAFPSNIQSKVVAALKNYVPLGKYIQEPLNKLINYIGCKFNPNDPIGQINKVFNPISYGAGPHADRSSSGDYTLKYTISVTKV